jgi:YD repeat-containing protein
MKPTYSECRDSRLSLLGRLFTLSLMLVLAAGITQAQSSTDGTTPTALAPGSPAGSYALSGFEDVNLFNGNLNFNLPLVGVKGRGSAGHTVTLSIDRRWSIEQNYNDQTNSYSNIPVEYWWEGVEPGYGPGVLQLRSGGDGSIQCGNSMTGIVHVFTKTLTRLTFTSSDGTEYELRDAQTGGQPASKSCLNSATQFNRGKIFITADGSSATFISDADITDSARFTDGTQGVGGVTGYLLLRDGTRYRFNNGVASWVRDRNGNLMSYTYDTNRRVTAITDSLGRQVTVAYNQAEGAPYGTCDRITYNGFGGASRVIRVCKTNLGSVLRTTRPYDLTAPQTYKALFPALNGSNFTNYDGSVVAAVWLPDDGVNRRAYKFYYNTYGELARVELPTGGAIEYDYAGGYIGGNADGAVGTGFSRRAHIYRRVLGRRVYPDGTNLEGRTAYSRPEGWNGGVYFNDGYVAVEQFDAAGTRQTYERHFFNGSANSSFLINPTQYSSWQYGREYKTEVFDATASTPLRRVERTWQQRASIPWWNTNYGPEPPNDPRLVTTVTTIEPNTTNLVSKTTSLDPADPTGQTVGYDQYNNQTDSWAYDYGAGAPGALLSRSHSDYVYTYASPSPSYNSPYMRSLPWKQYVYDAGGVPRSYTAYEYDNYTADANHAAPLDRASITNLCTAYTTAGVCSNPSPSSYTTRGNVTSAVSYLLDNVGSVTGSVSAYSQYDVAGNVIKSIDARGKVSEVIFGDSFCNGTTCGVTGYTPNTFAFAVTTKSPKPDPAGTYGSSTELTTSTVYDFWTGHVYSSTDANNKTATMEYGDLLDRPTAQARPDGGRTDIEYAPDGSWVRVLNDMDAGRRLESKQYFDGLGRGVRSFTLENQDATKPWLTVDSQYDSLGRAWRVSNQYRSTGPGSGVTTSGWTEMTFDSLGRVTKVKKTADGSFVTTAYSGNTVTVTDQHDPNNPNTPGHSRRSVTDALGRLTQVVEDPYGAFAYSTLYTYDVLGNLRKVDQGGQLRYFMYDSLGRLTRAKNPEQDVNTGIVGTDPVTGNTQWTVGYAYDENGNVTTRTDARGVTMTYVYDALNRNTTTDYSDTSTINPDIKRFYDGAVNGKGRYNGFYKGGDYTTGANVEHASTDSFDAMGRPLVKRQLFKTNGVWSQTYQMQLTYDKAGNVLTETYPSGHAVSYNYDAAGRLGDNGTAKAFSGNLGDGVARTYDSEVRYHVMGGMEQERFGADTPVYNKSLYNSRGQLGEIRVSTYSITSPGQETNWNRGAIINHYSASGWGATGGGPDNNGNLQKQEVYIPNDDAITGYFNVVQYYGYDALNRLSSIEDKPNNGSPDFYQAYTYDRWGNRTVNAGGTWNAPAPQFTASAATNRLSPPAGYTMTYDPAGSLTYDNYTGAGTRTYDAENRMTSAQDFYGQTSVYSYDAESQRVRRQVAGGASVWQIYGMGGELLAEYAANAAPTTPQKEYGYRSGELLVVAESAETYRASTDFSNVQGQRNWYYLDSNGAQMTFDPANNWWRGAETYNVIWANGEHPGNAADAVRQWRSPGSGSVRITGSAADANTVCGDGVIVTIRKGTQVLWQQTVNNGDTTGFSYDITTAVASGDQINFVVNKRGENTGATARTSTRP